MLSKSAARAFFLLGTIDFAAVFLLLTWYTAPAMIMRYMSQRESLCGPQDRPSDCLSDHGTGWLLWVSGAWRAQQKWSVSALGHVQCLSDTAYDLSERRGPNSFLACEEKSMDEHRELRQQLMSRLARIEGRLDKVEKDRRRGSNTLEPDWEEQATVRQNDEVLDELAEEERLQAIAIRAALQRMEDGTYGRCVTCDAPIVPQRLEALPYATQCIACATQTEQRGRTGR